MTIKTHLMFLALATTLAMSAAVFAQQETTPPPAGSVQTPAPNGANPAAPTSASMTKDEMKAQRKTQKAQEKAAKENAKAQKAQADALKHQDKATDAAQQAQQPH